MQRMLAINKVRIDAAYVNQHIGLAKNADVSRFIAVSDERDKEVLAAFGSAAAR